MSKTAIKLRICCPLVLYEEISAVFKLKNISNWHWSRQKIQFSNFQSFYAVLVKFVRNLVDWNVKSVNKEKGSRLVLSSCLVFYEEIIAVF